MRFAWSDTRTAKTATERSLASANGGGTWVSRKSVTKLLLGDSSRGAGGDNQSDSDFTDSEDEQVVHSPDVPKQESSVNGVKTDNGSPEMVSALRNLVDLRRSSRDARSPRKPRLNDSSIPGTMSDLTETGKKEEAVLSGSDAGSESDDGDASDAGYYVSPSLRELSVMADHELANLKELIIGRRGKGEVVWRDVDARGLDLDRSVLISQGMICVYPSEEDVLAYNEKEPNDQRTHFEPLQEPSVGSGLNKPATISLLGLFPKAATKHAAQEKMVERQVRKLKRTPNTEFVSYDQDTGAWTFNVEHFSRYAMADSDDDSESEPEERRELRVSDLLATREVSVLVQIQSVDFSSPGVKK